MKSLKTLMVALLALIGLNASAQEIIGYDTVDVKTEFQKHAFLTLQGGAQYTLGEAKFGDLISPNVQLGIGYQFSPVFAMRLQANAWQSKGGWNGYVPSDGVAPYTNDYKFNYVAPGLDFMFNLSNLFCGYNPKRVFNVTAFLGGGANIAWGNDEANEIGATLKNRNSYLLEYLWDGTKVRAFGRGGLELGFRLSDAVSLLVEGNANILSDHYNSKKADNPDWYFNGLIGLRINLGKTHKTTYTTQPIYAQPKPEPQRVVEPAPVKKVEPLRRDVFFTINSTQIVDQEMVKVDDIAKYLNDNANAKVEISGYADKGTGTAKINARLAEQRAEIVAKTLRDKYGISPDRISVKSYGDTVQPFAENDQNRVSICIANPE